MRMELQLSYTFMADFLAGKVVSTIAGALPVGTTISLAQMLSYHPSTPANIANQAPGVIRATLQFGVLQLQLDLGAAVANNEVQITATLANYNEIVSFIQSAVQNFDTSQIPSKIQTALDVTTLLAVDGATPAQIPAPTQAAFAADDDAKVVALRVEVGPVASANDMAAWAQFTANQSFTPLFQPSDVTVNPPRHWAVAIDWQALQPVFVAQIKPVVKQKLQGVSADGALTGDLLFAWNLKNGAQSKGFADGWPLGGTNTADLDVTCPVHVSGHDGHVYIQAQFSSAGLNHMKVHALLKAHVSCVWKDVDPVDLVIPIGGFPLETNVLLIDGVRTDGRGLILGGDVLFEMPLLFPTPQVDVGAFFWTYLDSCNRSTLCQDLGVFLSGSDNSQGFETPLRSKIQVTASFPVTVNSSTKPDANGVYTGDVAWDISVNASNVPQAGGEVTVSIQTNAGTPSFGVGTTQTIPLAPALTPTEQLALEGKAVTACQNAKRAAYTSSYLWTPPEEIIWWLTQEVNITPAAAGQPVQVTLGPSVRTAVSQAELPAAMRQLREGNQAIIRSTSTSTLGVHVVYSAVQRGE